MLEKIPRIVGKALGGIRPGLEATVGRTHFGTVPATIVVASPAFGHDAPLPADASEDGRKVSPALTWRNVPPGSAALVLIVEDADSPTPAPLVHAIALDLPGGDGGLAEGALPSEGSPGQPVAMGRNSFGKPQFLPADPPTGHGVHRYVFQVYALGRRLSLGGAPGRDAVVQAMTGLVLAKGVLVGTYERR